jgi:ATP-dependent Clp protease ATP-binding subunit ClpC
VILLDEIEKAHPDVFNVLLQVLDDGRMTDGQGRTVDFKNTVIVMTSNLGSQVIQGMVGEPQEKVKDAVWEEVKLHFRPEFLNRIDDIILFKALGRDETRHIVRLQLEQVQRVAHSQDIGLRFDDSIVDHLATVGYRPEFGARELRRQIRQLIENGLAKEMLKGDIREGSDVVCRFDAQARHVVFEPVPKGEAREAAQAKEAISDSSSRS